MTFWLLNPWIFTKTPKLRVEKLHIFTQPSPTAAHLLHQGLLAQRQGDEGAVPERERRREASAESAASSAHGRRPGGGRAPEAAQGEGPGADGHQAGGAELGAPAGEPQGHCDENEGERN